MAKKRAKYNHYLNGWDGIRISKLIEFIFDVKPKYYDWIDNEKTYVFYIENNAICNEMARLWVDKIEKRIGIKIIGV